MRPDKRRDKDLVFCGQDGQSRRRKSALDGDVLVDQADAFDFEQATRGQASEGFPVKAMMFLSQS